MSQAVSVVIGSKRSAFLWIGLGLLAGMALMAILGTSEGQVKGAEHGEQPSISITPNEIDFEPGARSSRTTVWIRGSGFAPGIEVSVIISDGNQVWTDITTSGTQFPLVVNDDGAFATQWELGRFSRNGVGGEGMFTVRVTDQEFNVLATGPLALCNLSKRAEGEEVPHFCSS